MKSVILYIAAAIAVLFALAFIFDVLKRAWQRRGIEFKFAANIAEKTHREGVTRLPDAVITVRHLLYKQGVGARTIAVAGAADIPFGSVPDEAAATTDGYVRVKFLGSPDTHTLVAASAISIGNPVFCAAGGKVAATGSVYIGRALTPAAADNDTLEVLTTLPSLASGARQIFAGVHTWAGGAATTDVLALAGLAATDIVLATPVGVAGAGLLQKAVPTTNTLTFTTSANFANGDKISYLVLRAN